MKLNDQYINMPSNNGTDDEIVLAVITSLICIIHWKQAYFVVPFLSLHRLLYFLNKFISNDFSSFERHIIIFYKILASTRSKRIFIHYVTMLICVGYPLVFYVCTILLYPCSTYYDSTARSCIDGCSLSDDRILSMYDTIVHDTILTFLVIVFNITLLIRVVRHKRRMRQNMSWNQHRKITV